MTINLETVSTADLLAALQARDVEVSRRLEELEEREAELEEGEAGEPREMEDQWLDQHMESMMGCGE